MSETDLRPRRRRNISSDSAFEAQYSYSRAVVIGSHVMLSGTTGYDYAASTLAGGRRSRPASSSAMPQPPSPRPERTCPMSSACGCSSLAPPTTSR